MRVLLVSRYPRMDAPGWKRDLATELHAAGMELAVLYSRAALADQARAGLKQYGTGILGTYLARRPGADAQAEGESLGGWAEQRGLAVFRHRRLGDADALGSVREWKPDLALLVGADIAPGPLLALPPAGTLNAHYGLLPAYRGMNVTEWAIYQDDPVGVTVHWVDRGIDTGAIAAREEIEVRPGATLEGLRARHQEVAARLMAGVVKRVAAGEAPCVPQAAGEGRQYYRMHPHLRAVVEEKLRSGRYACMTSV